GVAGSEGGEQAEEKDDVGERREQPGAPPFRPPAGDGVRGGARGRAGRRERGSNLHGSEQSIGPAGVQVRYRPQSKAPQRAPAACNLVMETSPPGPLSRQERGSATRQAGGSKPLSYG